MTSRKDRRSAYIVTAPDEYVASLSAGTNAESSGNTSSKNDCVEDDSSDAGNGNGAQTELEGGRRTKARSRGAGSRPRNAREAARAAREAIELGSGKADRFANQRRPQSGSQSTTDSNSPGRVADMGRLSLVGAIILAALTCLSPWFFGSITALYVFILLIGFAGLVAIWWTAVATQGGRAIQMPWNLVPLLLVLGFAGFQLVPLPESWLQALTPAQYALREELEVVPSKAENGAAEFATVAADEEASVDLLGPIHESRDGLPISLNPQGTRDYLLLLLIATTAFSCAVVFLRRRRWFLAFASVIAINGFLLSVFGIVQYFTGDGKIYWTYGVDRGIPFASFVNGNNAGGYLNLCLACLLGVALNAFRSTVHNRRLSLAAENSEWGGEGDKEGDSKSAGGSLLTWFADLTVWKLFLLLMIATIMAGLYLTLSRGAIIANVVALVLTALVMTVSRRHRAAGLGLVLVVILGGIFTFGLNEVQTVNRELASLQEFDYENDARLLLLRDLAPHWQSYVWTGAGLGSFRDVYRIHRVDTNDKWFYHADNTFLEAYFETGLIGVGLLLVCIIWTLWQAIYLLRHGETTADNAIGVIATFAVFSQFTQAFSDFGLYVPANMILMAIICGGTAIHAHRVAEARKASRSESSRSVRLAMPPMIAWVIPLALFGTMIWLVRPAQRNVELDFAMSRAVALLNVRDKSEMEDEQLEQAIHSLSNIAELTNDGEAFRRIGDLNVVRYRIAMTDRLEDKTKELAAELQIPWRLLYRLTSPTTVHGRMVNAQMENKEVDLQLAREDPLAVNLLEPAFESYLTSRQFAPFQALTYLRIAELSPLQDDTTVEDRAIERAVLLSPGRAEVQVRAGVLKANRGKKTDAKNYWKRSLALSEQYREQILNDASLVLSDEDIVPDLLPVDPVDMTNLLNRFERRGAPLPRLDPELVTEIYQYAVELYEELRTVEPMPLRVEDFIALHIAYRELGDADRRRSNAFHEVGDAFHELGSAFHPLHDALEKLGEEVPTENKAKRVLESAIKMYPKRTEHRVVLAKLLVEEENFTRARQVVSDGLFYGDNEDLVNLMNEINDKDK